MKKILNFLIEIAKLKDVKRRGITFYGIKNPPNTLDHTFRTAIMAWVLRSKKRINIEKIIKMALIHDLCKIYAGDISPYDGLLPKRQKEKYEFVRTWPPRAPLSEKEKKYNQKFKKEFSALKKLVSKLPKQLKKEIMGMWLEYYQGKSREAKFVSQLDVVENLLESLEQYKKNKKFPTRPWWEHADEVVDDPVLLKFLEEIEKEELKGGKVKT